MAAHEREEYRQRMGHVWLGFPEDLIRRFVDQAGFSSIRIDALAPATEAKGPALFAAVARKSEV
jgi:ArsR family transcriptional regulator